MTADTEKCPLRRPPEVNPRVLQCARIGFIVQLYPVFNTLQSVSAIVLLSGGKL